jgi:hypothetical protein
MLPRRPRNLRLSGYERRFPTSVGEFSIGGGGPCGERADVIVLHAPSQEVREALASYYRGSWRRQQHFYLEYVRGVYVDLILFFFDTVQEAVEYVTQAVEAKRAREAGDHTWGDAAFDATQWAEEWTTPPTDTGLVQPVREHREGPGAAFRPIGKADLSCIMPEQSSQAEAAATAQDHAPEPDDSAYFGPTRWAPPPASPEQRNGRYHQPPADLPPPAAEESEDQPPQAPDAGPEGQGG